MAEVTVRLDGPDHEVALVVGDTVAILLPESPTTGFQWSIERGSDLLEVIDSTFDAEAPARMTGAEGTRRIRLCSRKAGVATVTLAYRRPWEPDAAAGRRRVLRAVIREPHSERR